MLTQIEKGRDDHEFYMLCSLSHQVIFHHVFALKNSHIQHLKLVLKIPEGWNELTAAAFFTWFQVYVATMIFVDFILW